MNLNTLVAAEHISESAEACVDDLMYKLCEGEPKAVRDMAYSMLATRLVFACGMSEYFTLPPLDEI